MKTLSVTVVGTGTVTSTPAGIDCSSGTCSAMFTPGTAVSLATSSANGSVLTGFSGACTGATPCTVTLNADQAVSATFALVAVGNNAGAIAVTPDGTRALVALKSNPGQVKVISLADYSVMSTIAVGNFPNGIAVSPDGTKALVTHGASLTLITLATGGVTPISVPCAADTLYGVAISSDSTFAALPILSSGCTQSLLGTINLATNVVTAGPNLNTGAVPQGVAITADNLSVLVTLGVTGTTIRRVTLNGGTVTSIPNTSSSFGVAIVPGGNEALIASGQQDTIKRLSLANNTITGNFTFESNQNWQNLAVSPDGGQAVAAGDFKTGVMSLANGTVSKTYNSGGNSVAITPDGKRALVTSGSSMRVFPLQ